VIPFDESEKKERATRFAILEKRTTTTTTTTSTTTTQEEEGEEEEEESVNAVSNTLARTMQFFYKRTKMDK